MAKCFSFAKSKDWLYRFSFSLAGLKSVTADLGEGTVMHCWIPKIHKESKPTLILIHGVGANAMWQWNEFISPLIAQFNVYVPDLVFFGKSFTSRPDRSESFQAQCVARVMEVYGVRKMDVVGISYGGFVGYSLAAQFPERVERLVICCAGVCMEDKDMDDGMFRVKSVDEAVSILFPQTPEKMMDLLRITFHKQPKKMPIWFLNDFIQVMCTENLKERKELINALHKDRKMSNLPQITQPTLLIWGEYDQVFPIELGHRLKRHVGESAELVIIEDAGHAINAEKPKELYMHLKSFLIDPLSTPKQGNLTNGHKVD